MMRRERRGRLRLGHGSCRQGRPNRGNGPFASQRCAWAGHFARGDEAFTRAMNSAVWTNKYEAAELCLAWGGDINDGRFDIYCGGGVWKDKWVVAARAGEIEVAPQDPGVCSATEIEAMFFACR